MRSFAGLALANFSIADGWCCKINCFVFLVGPALVRRVCTRATECSSVLDLVRAVAMDSCVIKPVPLLALQPGCLHRAETSSARLRQLGMQSTSGQVVERLGYLLGRPTPRLGTPPGIGMGGASITPGKSETRPGGQPKATGKIGREQDRVGRNSSGARQVDVEDVGNV